MVNDELNKSPETNEQILPNKQDLNQLSDAKPKNIGNNEPVLKEQKLNPVKFTKKKTVNPNHIPTPHVSSISSFISSEKKEMKHKRHPDGQTSDIFEPISSLADSDELKISFVQNVIRHFNPDRAVLVVRNKTLDVSIIVDPKAEIWMGEQRRGNIDDLEPYQTIKYQTDQHQNVTFLQVIAGVYKGKIKQINQGFTEDGEGQATLIVEDTKKKSLDTL